MAYMNNYPFNAVPPTPYPANAYQQYLDQMSQQAYQQRAATQRPAQQFDPRGQQQAEQEQFLVVPCASFDEAKKFAVDPLYTYFFVNHQNGNIYYKKLGDDGLSVMYTYVLQESADKKDLEAKKKSPIEAAIEKINSRLDSLESKLKGGVANGKPVRRLGEHVSGNEKSCEFIVEPVPAVNDEPVAEAESAIV